MSAGSTTAPGSVDALRGRVGLLALAVILLALNLRAAVNVIGPLLPAIRADLDLSGTAAGALTALPTFCFALLGATGPSLTRRFGPTRTIVAGLVGLVAGQLLRAVVPGVAALFGGSLIALASIAVLNVLLPVVITQLFPGGVARMTAVYTVVLAAGGAAASGATLPIQHALGGDWRVGIGLWAPLAVLALMPWMLIDRGERGSVSRSTLPHLSLTEVARSRRAWVLAVFFGMQAFQAYVVFTWYPTILRDAGVHLTTAAAYVALISIASMVASMFVPGVIQRLHRKWVLVLGLGACLVGGYTGTLMAARTATWLWAVLIGCGTAFFPLGLYLVSQRARTLPGVLALSGFMQCLGYLVSGCGLLALGVLQGDSTNWTPVLVGLIVLTVVQVVAALDGVRHWHIEDEMGRRPSNVR